MAKKSLLTNFTFWRYLINFWSLLFWSLIIYDFLGDSSGSAVLDVVSMIYIGVLAIYVSNKEFERWYDQHSEKHPGEVFVIIWSILVFSLIIPDIFQIKSYHLPSAVVSAYIAVLTLLAVTRKSKQIYQRRHRSSK